MQRRTVNAMIQVIPFINNFGNEMFLEIFRSAGNCIKQINRSIRSSHW